MALNSSHRCLATFAVLLLGSTTAWAVEGDAFAERLRAVAEEQGTPLSYANVQTEGETVVLEGVRTGAPEDQVELGTIRFEDVTGSDSEGWRVERVPFPAFDQTEGETRTRASGLVLEGLTIAPTGTETQDALTALQFERALLESLNVDYEDREVFSLAGLAVDNTPGENGGFSAEFEAREFVIDTTARPETQAAQTLEALGYPQVRGAMSGNALWNTQSGELALSPLRFTVEDAGDLSFSYTITGYTPAFVQSLAQIQQQMAANPESAGGGMAMLGLLSQLYLNSAELSFTDDSLTGRLLDYYAEQNDQSRDDLIASLLGTLPLALNYLNNPEFQAQTTEAVEQFLRDPQSLTIAIDPDQPVPAPQIMGAAMGAPQTIPALLNLNVTANE